MPWWMLALALSGVTLGYWFFTKRLLGVSGSWAKIILWRESMEIARKEAPFRNNPALLSDALMAATIKHFGELEVQRAITQGASQAPMASVSQPAMTKVHQAPTPWTAHLIFLIMLIFGGVISAHFQGTLELRFDLGDIHSQLFGAGFSYWLVLVVGGILVGFGTQLAGGCTSGHALSGATRLVPASLIATGFFFASAVAFSLLLDFFGV